MDSMTNDLRAWARSLQNNLGSIGGSADTLYGTVRGDHSFNFTLQCQGGVMHQTAILMAKATDDAGGSLGLRCTWSRKVGGEWLEIPGEDDQNYQVSADDVGTSVRVDAYCTTAGWSGKARGELGPFELDPSTARSLDNVIGAEGSKFPVRFHQSGDSSGGSDLVVHVMADEVKVQQHNSASAKEKTARYSADYPRVTMTPKDTVRFDLELRPSRVFQLSALSRTSRDLIALAVRAFHARRFVATSFVLQQMHQDPSDPGRAPTRERSAIIDLNGLVLGGSSQLRFALEQSTVSRGSLLKQQNEMASVSAQLEDTISSYSKMIANLQASLGDGGPGVPPELLKQRVSQAQTASATLAGELAQVKNQIEVEADAGPDDDDMDGPGGPRVRGGGDPAAQTLRNEAQALTAMLRERERDVEAFRNRASASSSSADGPERAAVERTQQELTTLQEQRRSLMARLEVAQASGSAPSPAVEQVVRRLQQELEQAAGERVAMARRADQLSKELEKSKSNQEGTMQRLMAANARLLEEKEKLEREIKQVSELYDSTVRQLGVGGLTGSALPSVQMHANVHAQHQISQLEQQLAARQQSLTALQQEQENMKRRIRSLATAA